jgi:iron-sulfur cluster assembly protein
LAAAAASKKTSSVSLYPACRAVPASHRSELTCGPWRHILQETECCDFRTIGQVGPATQTSASDGRYSRKNKNPSGVEKIMGVTLTEKAAAEVKRVMQENDTEPGTMLRIGVIGGGCSGLSYDFRFDEQFDAVNDKKTEQHGITLVVDKKSALFLEGTTVDWHEGIDARGFTFNNPNAAKSCGCGSSFQA